MYLASTASNYQIADARPQACLYGHSAKRTPIFLRFSTVTFGREFADSGRNPRGFAIKHYTEDGNYDMVGLNWVSPPCTFFLDLR